MKKATKHNNLFDAQMYGSTLVGSRGQIVIPVEARKDLKLKTGDRLMVIGKHNKILGLVKAEDMTQILEGVLSQLKGLNK